MAKRTNGGSGSLDRQTLNQLESTLSRRSIENLARDMFTRLAARGPDSLAAPLEEITALCAALCAPHPYAAKKQIMDLQRAGVSVDRIYREYLAIAARELGARWDRDTMSFQDVGNATARIYAIITDLRQQGETYEISYGRRLAFAAAPGEHHTLGLDMAVDGFRRAGWDVAHLIAMSHDEMLDALLDTDIALVGLSASGRRSRASLIRLLVALRVQRPDLIILLSGEIAKTDHQLARDFGVDHVVTDIREALHLVDRLLGHATDPQEPES